MTRTARLPLTAWEIARATGTLVRIEIGLRTQDLPSLCRHLGLAIDLTGTAPPAAEPAALPAHTRRAVRACLAVARRWPAGDTCLRRCLLVGHRLRALAPVLRIGVNRSADGVFAAHSWLELGACTLDPTASGFAPLGTPGG